MITQSLCIPATTEFVTFWRVFFPPRKPFSVGNSPLLPPSKASLGGKNPMPESPKLSRDWYIPVTTEFAAFWHSLQKGLGKKDERPTKNLTFLIISGKVHLLFHDSALFFNSLE